MKIKTVQPINFLYFQTETTIKGLANFFPVSLRLMQEAAKLELTMAGPIHWHYKNFAGDEDKPFTLEVALPVINLPKNYAGEFKLKRSNSFKCVSTIHEGSWLEIPNTYGAIMNFMVQENLLAANENRELYIQTDFENANANVTEIQMGIL